MLAGIQNDDNEILDSDWRTNIWHHGINSLPTRPYHPLCSEPIKNQRFMYVVTAVRRFH